MSIRCHNCGRDNRDTANFCIGCGQRDLQVLAAQPWPQPAPPAPQPLARRLPAPLRPQPPSTPAPQAAQLPLAANQPTPRIGRVTSVRALVLEGVVEAYNQDEVYPPPDAAQALAKVGVAVAVLPLTLYFFTGIGIVLIVIIVLGGGLILAVFGALIGAFARLFSLIMPRRRPADRKLTQVHMIVQQADGAQIAALLYGDHIAGMLHKGDIVAIYGRLARNGIIRATRVEVVGVQFAPGASARRVVKGRRPFPRLVAAATWLIATAAWLIIYLPPIMQWLQSR